MSASLEGKHTAPSSRMRLRRLLSNVSTHDISRLVSRYSRRHVPPSPPDSARLSMFGHGQDTRIHNSTINATVNYHYRIPTLRPLGFSRDQQGTQLEQSLTDSTTSHTMESNMSHAQPSPSERLDSPRSTREVYVDTMITQRRGFPLWIPSPNASLPPEYRHSGVSIGDVGVLTPEGGFDFIFNIFSDFSDPVNAYSGLTDEFCPLRPALPRREVQRFKESVSGALLSSGHFTRVDNAQDHSVVLTTQASEAAFLMMPEDVYVVKIQNQERLRAYVSMHIENWYIFVRRTLGRDIKNGDLRVVYGYRKSTAFGTAAISTGNASTRTRLTFCESEGWARRSGYKYRWIQAGSADVRTGPEYLESAELMYPIHGTSTKLPENQCLFISTIDAKLGKEAWKSIESLPTLDVDTTDARLSSSASPSTSLHHQNRPSPNDNITQESSLGTSSKKNLQTQILLDESSEPILHPSSILNDVLLEMFPEAYISIVCDDDWQDHMKYTHAIEFVSKVLQGKRTISINGVVYMESEYPGLNPRAAGVIDQSGSSIIGPGEKSEGSTAAAIVDTPLCQSFVHEMGRPVQKKSADVTVLLLGQSEAGKSTTLKQFLLAQSADTFSVERMNWRGVIYLNVLHSITRIFEALAPGNDPLNDGSGKAAVYSLNLVHRQSPPPVIHVNNYAQYRQQLRPLDNLGKNIRQTLLSPTGRGDISVIHGPMGQLELRRQDQVDPIHVLHTCAPVISQLWRDPEVQTALRVQELRLEEAGGFYLEDITRVAAKQYIPTDADILKARLKTTRVTENELWVPSDGGIGGKTWRIYDVCGSQNRRNEWTPYFQLALDAIIFVASLSPFDQVLAENHRINRVLDSLQLWREIVSNRLLAHIKLVLFLNKADLLKAKLQEGIKIGNFLLSFKDQINDYPSVVHHLKEQFTNVHTKFSVNKSRFLQIHVTTMIDTSSAAKAIFSVQDVIAENLVNTELV